MLRLIKHINVSDFNMSTSLLSPNSHIRQSPHNVVRIHGLQNSGTNLLAKYLQRHFNLYIDASGWKHQLLTLHYCHQYPSFIDPRVLKIFVIKDPYFWLQSMFKSPYEVMSIRPPLTVNDYIQRPVKLIEERGGAIYRTPIDYWCLWYDRNIRIMDHYKTPMIMIRYEDLLMNPIQVMTELEPFLHRKPDTPLTIIEEAAKSHGHSRNRQQALAYYSNKENRIKGMTLQSQQMIQSIIVP